MKPFHLVRQKDHSGVSGTGIVAEGVQFSTGTCVVHWLSKYHSTGIYESIAAVHEIHGHDGSTTVVYDERKLT